MALRDHCGAVTLTLGSPSGGIFPGRKTTARCFRALERLLRLP